MQPSDVDMVDGDAPSLVAEASSSSGLEYKVHPLVLINISDHHTRTAVMGGAQPVIGCLLGQHTGRIVDISNSFEMQLRPSSEGAVPIVDQTLFDAKLDQYQQNFATLDVVGWYATGAGPQERDVHIHRWVKEKEKMEAPFLLTMDPSRTTPDAKDLPIAVYESVHNADNAAQPLFVKAAYAMETSDAERIGVNTVAHILPTGADGADSALSQHYSGLFNAMEMLSARVQLLLEYLKQMQAGAVPYNHKVMRMVSGLLHKLPTMESDKFTEELLLEYSDAAMITMLSIMTKGVDSCHELVERSHIAYENFMKTSLK